MAATLAASGMSAAKRYYLHSPTQFTAIWMLLLPLLAAAATAAPTSTSTSAAAAAPTSTSTSAAAAAAASLASASTSTADRRRCAHKGIAELIRTSPIIVKALAARIFTDAELNDVAAGASSKSPAAAILITLTPETIYKGASLLKMGNGADPGARRLLAEGISSSASEPRSNSFASVSGSNGWSATDAAYQYEGQLNATVQPLQCFDANMLKMLPTELIAFGKLLPASSTAMPMVSRQMQRSSIDAALASDSDVSTDKDVLHISVNGLHRWTPQFENHIWKHLGWDDWSDFTLCSVTCGKGVQQRFRRCLLDNPLVDINMNMNLKLVDDDDDDDDEEDENEDAEQEEDIVEAELDADEANNDNDVSAATATATATAAAAKATTTATTDAAAFNADNNEVLGHEDDMSEDEDMLMLMMQPAAAVATDMFRSPTKQPLNKLLHKFTQTTTASASASASASALMMTASTHAPTGLTSNGNEGPDTGVSFVPPARNDRQRTRANNQHKKRKAAKSLALSTLLCEGYNIEQRNCNSFECSDDINDLLKFYKKLPTTEELPIVVANDSLQLNELADQTASTTSMGGGGTPITSTPSNMGYIRNWKNVLNFTLMITVRAKNDTKNTSTIFSIRNATHNLYLEACKDGLRLYLERDNTTEMLPVKFNLYDYRWHQVAISIQNGDFISIYVDCLWTNSFVVSKRLFTLPMDADVEIGRGFNGELQQLLVLPEHQERLQCSNKRTSINEVKRYIIDTFIEDYASN